MLVAKLLEADATAVMTVKKKEVVAQEVARMAEVKVVRTVGVEVARTVGVEVARMAEAVAPVVLKAK